MIPQRSSQIPAEQFPYAPSSQTDKCGRTDARFQNLQLEDASLKALQSIARDIRKCFIKKVIGVFLLPVVIGVNVLRNASKQSRELSVKRIALLRSAKNEIILNKSRIQETVVEPTGKYVTYMIWSVKDNWSDQLESYLKTLGALAKISKWPSDFSGDVADSIKLATDARLIIQSYNEKFVRLRKKQHKPLFAKAAVPLDDEQQTAIVTDDKHNGVISGAGSGKTEVLVTRIAYLVNRTPDGIIPERILALAFQRKAAQQIEQRLKDRFGILDVKAKTFHSFGLEILRKAGVEPRLRFGDMAETEYRAFIEELHNKAITEPEYRQTIIEYMKHYEPDSPKSEVDFETKEEFYEYMRNLTYTTLNGTIVRSEPEKEIMNFFLSHRLNGKSITVRYEQTANWMRYINKQNITIFPKPDFYFPEYDIYLEHWAVDDQGRVPVWFGRDAQTRYTESMKKKIEKYKAHGKYLVETTSGEYSKGDFLGKVQSKFTKILVSKYPKQDFIFTPIPYEELVEKSYYDLKEHVNELPNQIASFITTAKTYALSPANIRERLSDKRNKWSQKQIAFANIAVQVYEEYDTSLRASNEIDFADMINLAVEQLSRVEDLYKDSFDHILVDEYQDLSAQRYKLLKKLMEKNPDCKLFGVGDDWQSIMGFAGANLNYTLRFEDYFDHPAITYLLTNYRSNKSIVDLGAHIIAHNRDAQLAKKTKAKNPHILPIKLYCSTVDKYSWDEYRRQVAEHCINSIAGYLERGDHQQEIMVLMRITRSPALINALFRCAREKGIRIVTRGEDPTAVRVMSVHQSKGLQAKTVLLLNVIDHTYGFPCTLEDLDVLAPATDGNPRIKEEEERRLFYVAVTRAKENLAIYTQDCRQSNFIKEIKGHLHEEKLGAVYSPDRTPFKKPKLKRCSRCGTEFFEKELFERCPKCGGTAPRVGIILER